MENVGILLEEAHVYLEEKLKEDCLQVIANNASKFLNSDNFKCLCQQCVLTLIQQDDLDAGETEVYEAVLRWSDEECSRQKLEVTDQHRRKVMGDILYAIRFPLMDDRYFGKEICSRDLLSSEEVVVVLRLHHKKGIVSSELFKCERRKQAERILRFDTIIEADWNSSSFKDAIYFSVSKNATLHGICMYPSEMGRDIRLNDLTISTEGGDVLYKSNHVVEPVSKGDIFDVVLKQNIDIKENVKYFIKMKISGICKCFGENGRNEIHHDSIVVNFYNYETIENNFTSVITGQIPGLLLSFS